MSEQMSLDNLCHHFLSEESELRANHLLPVEEPETFLYLYFPTRCQEQAWNWGVYQRSVHWHTTDA